jgi:hypothetical protein
LPAAIVHANCLFAKVNVQDRTLPTVLTLAGI